MKMNCWLFLGTMLATTAVAQVNTTNTLPVIPPPATTVAATPAPTPETTQTNAPVKKVHKAKKKLVKKDAPAEKKEKAPEVLVTLVPGPATVTGEHINLRGQAGLQGEVVGHVEKGDTVTVIAQLNLDKPKAGEPSQWAKIALPSGTKVWIDSKYIDKTNNVVDAKKLNLRGGPGENYSVLGVIEKGAPVTTVTTKGDWTQIQTPASAFAFIAAGYLKQEVPVAPVQPPVVAATEQPAPAPQPAPQPAPAPVPPTPTTVAENQPIAPPAATPPPTPETTAQPAPAPVPAPAPTIEPVPVPTPTLAEEDTNLPPPPPRIVSHEGTVRHSVSPVAPTYYELYDPETDVAINYLYTSTTNLNLSRYDGMHITVTGEEALDPRWKDTPVLTIQKIYVLSGPAPAYQPHFRPVKK